MPLSASVRAALPSVCGYALAILVGWGASSAGLPLAWVLGPLIVSAMLSLAGYTLIAPVNVRRVGQLAVGATAGLNMTAVVLAQLVGWLPIIVASGLISILVSTISSVVLARASGLDDKTAFFACLPGGLTEMGNIGAQVGARPEPIAIVQTLRVALIVLILPPALVGFGLTADATPSTAPPIALWWVAILLAAGTAGALTLRLARLNNPWVLGAILTTAALTATGLVGGRMPAAVFAAAQLVIGFSLGTRFRRAVMRKLPHVALIGAATVVANAAVMVGYGGILAAATELDFASAALATSPGGMSEMAATAQILHLSVALIVAFHVTRALMVNGFATHHWTVVSRTGVLRRLHQLFGKPRGSDEPD